MTKYASQQFPEQQNEVLRLKQYKVDQAAINTIKHYGLYNQKVNTVIALAMLKLDDSLIKDVKALDIDNYSIGDFIASRTGKKRNSRHDIEMFNELANVVATIHRLEI